MDAWEFWLRGVDLNHRPLGYEPNELPDCSTPQFYGSVTQLRESNFASAFRAFTGCSLRAWGFFR
jgi:hypothetical protein